MALSRRRSERKKTYTKAASPVIRNEWDVCLALQEFQLKQLILNDSIVESAESHAGNDLCSPNSLFISNQGALLPIERSRFLRRLLSETCCGVISLRVLLREMRARSSIIAEPIFLYSDFGHGRALSTAAAIFMRLT
jgi:hypothetical protein